MEHACEKAVGWGRDCTASEEQSRMGEKVSSVLQGGDEGEQHTGQSSERGEPPQLAGTESMVAHYGSSASHPCCSWWAWIGSILSSFGATWPAELSKGSNALGEPCSRWRTGMGMGKELLWLKRMGKESHL